jgi:endonuclease/exonuclease/phosphatase family metal-dependent hydrolase
MLKNFRTGVSAQWSVKTPGDNMERQGGRRRAAGVTGLQIKGLAVLCFLAMALCDLTAVEDFRVATYNLNNYIDKGTESRPAKSTESKAKVHENIRRLQADVIALQEMGSQGALAELRQSLREAGCDYGHWEWVPGYDTNIHVAVLSRFPIIERRPHTNENFLLYGRRFMVGRGFAEIDIQVATNYIFTLITAHLKSRRASPLADEAELREQEAVLLREKIDALLKKNPNANLVVLGDFNDTKDSPALRAIRGRGKFALTDTRPAERNGDNARSLNPRFDPANVTWTYYYGKEDTYSRIDYILLSPGMAREWNPAESYVLSVANWGVASDHRPIVAGFWSENR